MPDFAMCNDYTCPFRRKCKRNPESGTKPDQYQQSWSFFEKTSPIPDDPRKCKGWMPKNG